MNSVRRISLVEKHKREGGGFFNRSGGGVKGADPPL